MILNKSHNPYVTGNGEDPGTSGTGTPAAVPWWMADSPTPAVQDDGNETAVSVPAEDVEQIKEDPTNGGSKSTNDIKPQNCGLKSTAEKSDQLEHSFSLGRCSDCNGPLVETPTFDGYLNLECLACDRCYGCRRADT